MGTCVICKNTLNSPRAKTCSDNKCKSAWKLQRNASLSFHKECQSCGSAFISKDRRNRYCSSKCKSKQSDYTKLKKYGTLRLESEASIQRRTEKLRKRKVNCAISTCTRNARTRGYCSTHYVTQVYLKTPEGLEAYRLQSQKRRHWDKNTKKLTRSELAYLRQIQTSCAKCEVSGELTIDHHIPLSKGGILALTNTVLLCASCNSKKHNKLPSEFYTEKELLKIEAMFAQIAAYKRALPKVFFLFGAFGVGKTWVANQVSDLFHVVEYDKHRDDSFKEISNSIKPVLFVSSIRMSTFINANSMRYDIVPIGLLEDLPTIHARILKRGGTITDNLETRRVRASVIAARYAEFQGNSVAVLEFLRAISKT